MSCCQKGLQTCRIEGVGKIQFFFSIGRLEVSSEVICKGMGRKFQLCVQIAELCHFCIETNVNLCQKVLMASGPVYYNHRQISFISPKEKVQDLSFINTASPSIRGMDPSNFS